MSTPHTPGPWIAESCGCYATDTPGGRCIIYCPIHAAAPEMLRILQAFLDSRQPCRDLSEKQCDYCEARIDARTLIARIENGG